MTKVIVGIFLSLLSLLAVAGMVVLNAALPVIAVSIVIAMATDYDFIEVLMYVAGVVAIVPITLLIATIILGNSQYKRR